MKRLYKDEETTKIVGMILENFLYFKRIFYFLFLSLAIYGTAFSTSQHIHPHQNANFKKYLKNHIPSNQNQQWYNHTILQDKHGIIYVGNLNYLNTNRQGGLQEYDGVSWRLINRIPGGIYSMALDDNGTIYTGGYNEIGFLNRGSNGVWQYKSLVGQLNKDEKGFGYVSYIHSLKEGKYFNCWKFIFRWDPLKKKIKVWKSKQTERFFSSFKINDKLFIHQENIGLMQMKNDHLKKVSGGKIFKEKKISMMVPYTNKEILIGTKTCGFYLFDGFLSKPFPTKVDKFLRENQLNHGIRMSCGDFALATAYGGCVIMDYLGNVKEIFDRSYGLQDNKVNYVFEDLHGNLWLALIKGISMIEYTSPLSTNENLNLFFYSIIEHHGVLYAGTVKGIFYLTPNGNFNHVPGTSSSYYFSLRSIDHSIFAATNNGVYQLVGNKINTIIKGDYFYCLLRSQIDKNRIWVGGLKGLFSIYKKNDQWKKEHHFENITERIESIVEDKKGNLWLGLNYKSTPSEKITIKVNFPGNVVNSSPMVFKYRITPEVLSHNGSYVFKAAGHIIFSTEKGLFRFDETNKEFIPDLTLGKELAGDKKTKGLLWLVEDKKKNIWFHLKSSIYLAKLQKDASYSIQSKPFRRIQSFYWYPIYPDPHEDITWFGSMGKLIRYNTSYQKNFDINFPTLIRRVTANGRLVYRGNIINGDTNSHARDTFPKIAHEDRNLSFEFAAPFFEDESSTQYRYFLEGYDNDWSDWSWETKKDYNSLPAGLYRFRAQSKNVYQHPGKEAVFHFKILLPWYRTGWAFLSYIIVFLCLTYLIVKWRRSFQLEKEKQKLEQTVSERTKEIEEQSEKLKEMDQVKSRFFANISHEFRTPLTLIMGSQEQILSNFSNKELKNKAKIALQNSHRLLGLINQLLDLSKLDSGKMKLRVCRQNIIPFLKGIVSAFEPVTEKKGLDLSLKVEKEDITFYFDPEKLEHVILNLLANAVKFTPMGGKITIEINDNPETIEVFPCGFLEISICDTGPGIPRNQLDHIFDRFYQADSAYENHPKGSGIGLALAKELIELHHGKLDIHSKEGQGSKFIIRLPMENSLFTNEEIVEDSKKPFTHKSLNPLTTHFNIENDQDSTIGIEEVQPNLKNGTPGCNEPINEIIEDSFSPPKPRKNIILVVEDHDDLRSYVRDCLEPLYEVIEAKNGFEGICRAQEIIPDLIISDIMMPKVDGYQLCQTLKSDRKTNHIPIILLTAKASEENIVEGLEIGADDYITKPFSTKILYARIKNLIDLREQLQLIRKEQMTLQPKDISVSTKDDEFFQELQKVIEENLSDWEFNVEQLAKKLYFSRSSLYRKILAITGKTPQQFIRTYRLKRGAQLLKANFGNVTEVSLEVGFSNLAHFTQCFKKEFNQLPSTYQSNEIES